jgi:hypothetical protein
MVCIYILELENNKYYVGKTANPTSRFEDHQNGNGSEWTRLYKPLRLIEVIEGDDYDEDKYTFIYMNKYGIENVRGGSFSQIHFSKETREILTRILNGSNNNCFNCGDKNHFVRECKIPRFTKQEDYVFVENEKSSLKTFSDNVFDFISAGFSYFFSSDPVKTKQTLFCQRCGRNSHNIENCYAKRDADGFLIRD